MAYGSPTLTKQLQDGFKRAGKRLDMGKACIRFQRADDLALEAIGDVIASTPMLRYVAYAEAVRQRKRSNVCRTFTSAGAAWPDPTEYLFMAAYVVVEISIHDPQTYERYKTLAPPSIATYGGRYLIRGGSTTAGEGDWAPERFVILEFASAERASGVVEFPRVRRSQGAATGERAHGHAARGWTSA